MSYLKKAIYTIIPKESYRVIRSCSGCGTKSVYRNTGRFRVNANGNKLDVWLIYQCERCKHTYNLSIFERRNPESIPPEDYQGFLENSPTLSHKYGTDRSFFSRNQAEINLKEIAYLFLDNATRSESSGLSIFPKAGSLIELQNPFDLKIRTDRIIADFLQITRSEEKKLIKNRTIEVTVFPQEKKIQIEILSSLQIL